MTRQPAGHFLGGLVSGVAGFLSPGTAVLAHDHGKRSEGHGSAARHARRRVAPAPLVTLGPGKAPRDPAAVGAKAASLQWLARQGVAVPAAVVLPVDVTARIARRDTLTVELAGGALRRWLEPGRRYAIRPSPGAESPGGQPTRAARVARLDLVADDVARAIHDEASPGDGSGPDALIVQEMIDAKAAGVSFSRNPLTGLDEVVVEAVAGGGDALLGEVVRQERWVRRWGTFTEEPAESRIGPELAEEVARQTVRLAKAFGRPLRLEWAHDGTTLWWLRAAPIGGLEALRVYSNRIAREVLPGVVKPLVWSVNVPIVNAAWIDLLEELVGRLDIRPDDLARSFGHRAYFDMTTLGGVFAALGMPRDSLELLLGLPKGPEAPRFRPTAATYRHLPRMGAVAVRSLRRGRWARREVVELRAAYDTIAAVDPGALDESALLARVEALTALTRRAAYANIVVPLIMLGYNRALERQLAAAGLDPRSADPAADRDDRLAWDPNAALAALRAAVDDLPPAAREDLAERRAVALAERDDAASLRAGMARFLDHFGHLSSSGSDFTVSPWREDPDHVVDMLLAHPEGTARGDRTTRADAEARVGAARRPLVRFLWRRAGAFRVYREAVSSTYTRGYGLFRGTFVALGTRCVERGLLDTPEDVFYLSLVEVRALATGLPLPEPGEGTDPRARVARRRAEVAEAATLAVPDTVFGDAFVPRRSDGIQGAALRGIPTSRGSVRGPARIVRDSGDFGRVQPGDVLVIPHSDVGWTPLFARAAAVIAEAGGMLSHSSIVSREYGIPCVVSVSGACASIPDGATVVVDGVAGTVTVEEPEAVPPGRSDP